MGIRKFLYIVRNKREENGVFSLGRFLEKNLVKSLKLT